MKCCVKLTDERPLLDVLIFPPLQFESKVSVVLLSSSISTSTSSSDSPEPGLKKISKCISTVWQYRWYFEKPGSYKESLLKEALSISCWSEKYSNYNKKSFSGMQCL